MKVTLVTIISTLVVLLLLSMVWIYYHPRVKVQEMFIEDMSCQCGASIPDDNDNNSNNNDNNENNNDNNENNSDMSENFRVNGCPGNCPCGMDCNCDNCPYSKKYTVSSMYNPMKDVAVKNNSQPHFKRSWPVCSPCGLMDGSCSVQSYVEPEEHQEYPHGVYEGYESNGFPRSSVSCEPSCKEDGYGQSCPDNPYGQNYQDPKWLNGRFWNKQEFLENWYPTPNMTS